MPEQRMAAAQANPNPRGAGDEAGALPPKVLVPDVPFVSFAEAVRIRLPHGALMYSNPSQTACLAMVLENWGYSQKLLERAEVPELDKWERSAGKARSLDEVKALLAKGVPVQVVVALTPYGDRFPDTEPIAETVRKIGAAEGPRSGVLGRIVRFEDLPKIEKEWGIDAEQDSMHIALFGSTRLIIGYDDERKVVVLHDPTFGPAFGMSYADFTLTWEVLGRRYAGSYPPDYANRLAKRGTTKPYRRRTPQEQAAEYYVYGYALNATGRPKEGEEQFRKGLAITGIGPGYQHLLQLELAIALAVQGNSRGAQEAAEVAAKLVPEDPMPWMVLADLYARSPDPGEAAKAEQVRSKAERLAQDERTGTKLSSVLPRDFWVMTLGHWANRITEADEQFLAALTYCKDLYADAALNPIRSKVVLDPDAQPTPEMLGNDDHATASERPVIRDWARRVIQCQAEILSKAERYLSPLKVRLFRAHNDTANALRVQLYNGQLSYGQYNQERQKLSSDYLAAETQLDAELEQQDADAKNRGEQIVRQQSQKASIFQKNVQKQQQKHLEQLQQQHEQIACEQIGEFTYCND